MSVSDSSDIGDSSENFSLTPPPTKIRAVGGSSLNSQKHSSLSNQDGNISQKHYELIVDANAMNSSCEFSSCVTFNSTYIESNSVQELYHPNDFGRSLLAGVCSTYCPHFVLSGIVVAFRSYTLINCFIGIDTRLTSFEEGYLAIYNDLISQNNQTKKVENTDLKNSCNSVSPTFASFGSTGSKQFLSTNTSAASNLPLNSCNACFSGTMSCAAVSQSSSIESGKSSKLDKTNTIVIIADCKTNNVKVIFFLLFPTILLIN